MIACFQPELHDFAATTGVSPVCAGADAMGAPAVSAAAAMRAANRFCMESSPDSPALGQSVHAICGNSIAQGAAQTSRGERGRPGSGAVHRAADAIVQLAQLLHEL